MSLECYKAECVNKAGFYVLFQTVKQNKQPFEKRLQTLYETLRSSTSVLVW